MSLDAKSKQVLEALMADSNRTTRQLSKYLAIPATTVHNHKRKLEEEGVIQKYVAIPDYKKIDRSIHAYILISIKYDSSQEAVSQEEVARQIKALGASSVSIVAGDTDIIAQVRVGSIDELNAFITQRLRGLAGVERTKTLISLSEE